VLTGEVSPDHPGNSPVTTMAWEAATGDYTRLVQVVDTSVLSIDPEIRAPRTDQLAFGVDRNLGSGLAAGIAYIRKTGENFIAWTDIGGTYTEEVRVLPDGRSIPVFNIVTRGSQHYWLTNPSGYSMNYDGLVMVVEKRRSNGWQAQASYTLSRTEGLQASSGGTAGDPQASTVAAAFGGTAFGRDPNHLTNAFGRLPNDRPHVVRLLASVEVPFGISVAGAFQHYSGKPWATTAQVELNQNRQQRILLEPRGSQRLPSQSLLDLRVAKRLAIGPLGRVDLLLDVLNVLNEDAEENLVSDTLFNVTGTVNPTYGRPSVFVDPRRVMLGVRVNVGQ
jgi:hypothetical protein